MKLIQMRQYGDIGPPSAFGEDELIPIVPVVATPRDDYTSGGDGAPADRDVDAHGRRRVE